MKHVMILLSFLLFSISTHAGELQLTQKIDISISQAKGKAEKYSKTMILGKETPFDIGSYRFEIKGKQVGKKAQAMIETKVSKKNDQGEFEALYSPTLMVMFKKQAQFKTEDGDVTIDFRTIVERQEVANE